MHAWRSTSRRAHRRRTVVRGLMMLLAAMPVFVPVLEAVTWTRIAGQFVRFLYGFQCHQSQSRSWTMFGAAMPVCSRCLGIYIGLGLASALERPRLRRDAYKAWILIATGLVGVDVLTEWVGLRPAQAGLRFATGALLSYGVGLIVVDWLQPSRRRS